MQKAAKIILLIAVLLILILPLILLGTTLLPGISEDFTKQAIEIQVALGALFPDFYFSILPGTVLLGLALLYYEKLKKKDVKKIARRDLAWISLELISIAFYILAFSASPDSIFFSPDFYLFGFLPLLGGFSPNLYTFTLWFTLFLFIISTIFLYGSLAELGFDKSKIGALIIAVIVSLTFAIFSVKVPLFSWVEELVLSGYFTIFRNPGNEIHAGTNMKYCPVPYDASGRKIDVRPPSPKDIRDDIIIVGISKETIEKLQGNWPLDWQLYADLADRFSAAHESILLFDISFLDDKGVYGGNYCGIKFDCTPRRGFALRRQVDVLGDSIARAQNRVLSDYPMETTDEAKNSIVNYQERLELLRKTSRLKNVHNAAYAGVWARLPLPPVKKILQAIDAVGYANILKNRWGMNRQMPIVIRIKNHKKEELHASNPKKYSYDPDHDDEFYMGIDLLLATQYFGVDPYKDIEVDWLAGLVTIRNIPEKKTRVFNREKFKFEVNDIMRKPNSSRSIVIPINSLGLMDINFRGGRYCFKFHEFLDVARMDPNDAANNFGGKIALVAMYYATGVGTAKDMHLSPYGDMAGIEHHAYALNTILNQDFAPPVSHGINLLILLIIGIIMGLYQPRVPTWMSFVLLFVIAVVFSIFTSYVTYGRYSYFHIFPTVIIEQFVIAIGFIGFRALTEEENVKFIRNTFSKFVSQDVVDELLNNPEAIALGGAKKEVSVFFSDVRGFTTISESLGPEELVSLLNEYLSVMTDLIIDYRGTIDKYMGDAIMAFWGAPVQNDEHAYYTCVAAVAQIEALQKMQREWSKRGGIPVLDIGIGINSGPAVVGNMGSSHRMDYTLMGDTVNLGSRLEGITKTYHVKAVISEFTYEKVKSKVYARELDLVKVKGKLKPVRIYELMGLVDDSDLEKYKRSYVKIVKKSA